MWRHVLPTTRRGRFAGWLCVAFAAWYVVNMLVVGLRGTVPEDASMIPLLILFGWVGLATGVVATVVAALSIVRDHERSIVAFLLLLPGLLVLAFVLGEILIPH